MNRTGFWRQEIAAPLQAIQDEVNRLLTSYRHGGETSGPGEGEVGGWGPLIDLVELPDTFLLWIDIPGVDPSSIDLSVVGSQLTLRGEKKQSSEATQGRCFTQERPFGPFSRQITLPGEVIVDGIQANAHDGVLEVRLPKAATSRSRTIPVRTVTP